jgi:hypothetical protein
MSVPFKHGHVTAPDFDLASGLFQSECNMPRFLSLYSVLIRKRRSVPTFSPRVR